MPDNINLGPKPRKRGPRPGQTRVVNEDYARLYASVRDNVQFAAATYLVGTEWEQSHLDARIAILEALLPCVASRLQHYLPEDSADKYVAPEGVYSTGTTQTIEAAAQYILDENIIPRFRDTQDVADVSSGAWLRTTVDNAARRAAGLAASPSKTKEIQHIPVGDDSVSDLPDVQDVSADIDKVLATASTKLWVANSWEGRDVLIDLVDTLLGQQIPPRAKAARILESLVYETWKSPAGMSPESISDSLADLSREELGNYPEWSSLYHLYGGDMGKFSSDLVDVFTTADTTLR